jgi:hypothetical protein
MKSHLHAASAIIALLAGPAVMSASAQNIYGQPGLGPGQSLNGPTVNPRNLLVPGAGAYPWAQNLLNTQSQVRYNQQIGQLQSQTGANAASISGLQQEQQALLLGGLTGHPVSFLNYKQYFLNLNPRIPVGSGFGAGGLAGAGLGAGGLAGLGGQDPYGLGGVGGAGGLYGNATFNPGIGTSGAGLGSGVGSARGGKGVGGQGPRTR